MNIMAEFHWTISLFDFLVGAWITIATERDGVMILEGLPWEVTPSVCWLSKVHAVRLSLRHSIVFYQLGIISMGKKSGQQHNRNKKNMQRMRNHVQKHHGPPRQSDPYKVPYKLPRSMHRKPHVSLPSTNKQGIYCTHKLQHFVAIQVTSHSSRVWVLACHTFMRLLSLLPQSRFS